MEYCIGHDVNVTCSAIAAIENDSTKPIDECELIFSQIITNKQFTIRSGKEYVGNTAKGERGQARRIRNHYDYKQKRKNLLFKYLENLCEEKVDIKQLKDGNSPWDYRNKGVEEKLSIVELYSVLLHMSNRRGIRTEFSNVIDTTEIKTREQLKDKISDISNKIGDDAICLQKKCNEIMNPDAKNKNNNDNEYYAAMYVVEDMFLKSGYKAIGQFIGSDNFPDKKQLIVPRYLFEKELFIILTKQSEYYQFLNEETIEEIRKIVFWEKGTTFPEPCTCSIYVDEKKCHKSSPEFQEFLMWQTVNALSFQEEYSQDKQKLIQDQKQFIINKLISTKNKISLESMEKALKKAKLLTENDSLYYWLKEFKTNSTYHGLKNIFEDYVERQNYYNNLFNDLLSPLNSFLEKGSNKYNLTLETLDKLRKVYQCNPGYGTYSLKAIKEIFLPEMRNGKHEETIKKDKKIKNGMTSCYDELQYPPKIFGENFDRLNPIAQDTLFMARQQYNKFLKYIKKGKQEPVFLKVALESSQVKNSAKAQEKIIENQNLNQKRNDEAAKWLKKNGQKIDFKNINKYKLYKETGGTCVYCGCNLSFKESEVEHINHGTGPLGGLEFEKGSESRRNDFNNLTISCPKCNKIKSNKTPYQSFGHESIWEEIKLRSKKHFSRNKHIHFISIEDNNHNGFSGNYLPGTQTGISFIEKYLKTLNNTEVFKVDARTVQRLRKKFGLGDKTRDSYGHHLEDALIAALSIHSYVTEETINSENFNRFIKKAKEQIKSFIPKHKENGKTSGKIHDDGVYAKTSENNIFTKRTKLQDITDNDVKNLKSDKFNNINCIDKKILNELIKIFDKYYIKEAISEKTKKEIRDMRTRELQKGIDLGNGNIVKSIKIPEIKFSQMVSRHGGKGFSKSSGQHHASFFVNSDNKIEMITETKFNVTKKVSKNKTIRSKRKLGLIEKDMDIILKENELDNNSMFITDIKKGSLIEGLHSSYNFENKIFVCCEVNKREKQTQLIFKEANDTSDKNKKTYSAKTPNWKSMSKINVDLFGNVISKIKIF